MNQPRFTTMELTLLLFNVLALGAVLVLIALRGPSVPKLLLAIGAAGMAIGKIGRAFSRSEDGA